MALKLYGMTLAGTLISVLSSLAMESAPAYKADVHESIVTIRNESSWPIEIIYKRRGKELSRRLEVEAEADLGKVGELSDVYYGTYGDYYGAVFYKKFPVNLGRALPGKNLKVIISTWLKVWTEKYVNLEPKKQPIIKETGKEKDPWEAFGKKAQNLFSAGDTVRAYRRIFGLTSNFSQAELDAAYRALILKWHPDKNQDQQEYATAVSKIITEAHEALKK